MYQNVQKIQKKNNISRNVIHAKRRQYEETTAEDHALVSSELKGEGKAERERERDRETERDVGESLLKYMSYVHS